MTAAMGSRGRSYRTEEIEGFQILVGRGDRENDELTFEVAEARDLWFHVAGGISGSHVVVRNPEGLRRLPKTVMQRAAELAAWHSKAQAAGGKVSVHVCRVADVSKTRGAPAGQVRLRTFETLKVYPRQ